MKKIPLKAREPDAILGKDEEIPEAPPKVYVRVSLRTKANREAALTEESKRLDHSKQLMKAIEEKGLKLEFGGPKPKKK